jgi:hypothetical protein
MAGTIVVSGSSNSEPVGSRTFGPLSIAGSAVIGETIASALASGDNTFTVPAGAVAALIMPPVGGTAALKVRTSLNNTDGGLPINAGPLPLVYAFPAAAPTSLIINASALQATFLNIAFI